MRVVSKSFIYIACRHLILHCSTFVALLPSSSPFLSPPPKKIRKLFSASYCFSSFCRIFMLFHHHYHDHRPSCFHASDFHSFRKCFHCNFLQPRDSVIISRMETSQVTIRKSGLRTWFHNVTCLYLTTLTFVRYGHTPFVKFGSSDLSCDWLYVCMYVL